MKKRRSNFIVIVAGKRKLVGFVSDEPWFCRVSVDTGVLGLDKPKLIGGTDRRQTKVSRTTSKDFVVLTALKEGLPKAVAETAETGERQMTSS